MKNEKLSGLLVMGLGVIFLIVPFLIEAIVYYDEPIIEYVECYDRSGNEIKDLVCEEEVFYDEKFTYLIWMSHFLIIIAFVLFVAGMLRFNHD